jgi:glycerate dehydrogenase
MPKIVILDAKTVTQGDLDFAPITSLADTKIYDFTEADEIIEKAYDYEIIATNKVALPRSIITKLPKLKLIALFATGYDSIDINACLDHGVTVANVPDYSSYSVVQTIFAHLLNITQKVSAHDQFVRSGKWLKSDMFSCWLGKLTELSGLTFGIIGFGNIGRKSANVAASLGMKVIVNTAHPEKYSDALYKFVSKEALLANADIISLNIPANSETAQLINKTTLSLMKAGTILINCSRGKLINEQDLADSLNSGHLAYACLDVLALEPPTPDNPLLSAKNCQITPHIGWATLEARHRIITETASNIAAYLQDRKRNVVL